MDPAYILTKREKKQQLTLKRASAPAHEWTESPPTPTFIVFKCSICGWKVKMRVGRQHNGVSPTPNDMLRAWVPVLDEKNRTCLERVVQKVMEA